MFKDVVTDMNIMQMGWFCVQRSFAISIGGTEQEKKANSANGYFTWLESCPLDTRATRLASLACV